MSSINLHYTFHYSQPEEYRFSHDSVFLARQVFERTHTSRTYENALDLCAGCGIVGLDYLFHHHQTNAVLPRQFDFVEVQESAYAKHFAQNRAHFADNLKLRFLGLNYVELLTEEWRERYDLVLCNPPFFQIGQGVLPASQFKSRCRFFVDSDLISLVRAIENVLRPQGEAYILLREPPPPANTLTVESLPEIRGTGFFKLTKNT